MRGDIVTVRWRGDLMVKRVVGLPGEEVEISNGDLYVTGALVLEAHPMKRGSLAVGKGKLFPGKLAILGDIGSRALRWRTPGSTARK